jgi:hypothetical protein
LDRCRKIYDDDRKALIAVALVLWRDRPVSEIRDYVDGDFGRQFAEVLSSDKGPIFYYRKKEMIWLIRWAAVLLGEGKDSKALSAAENERLQAFAFEICTDHHGGTITPRLLRDLADMGETKSEQVLSSNILAAWKKEGLLRKTGKGRYQFLKKTAPEDTYTELLNTFQIPPETPDASPAEPSI